MVDFNILFKSRPADLMRVAERDAALEGQRASNAAQMAQIGNALFSQQQGMREEERRQMEFQLKDMALDAIKIRPLLESGDTLRANVLIAERIKKIQQRGGDPSDTMAFRDALNSGQLTPQQAIGELDSVLEGARQAGVLEGGMTASMREWQQMTQGFTDEEKAQAQRIAAGLAPRQVMAAPRIADVGGVQTIINPNTSQATLPVLSQPIPGGAPVGTVPPPPTVLDANATASNIATVKGGEEAGKQAIQMSGDALKKLPDVRRAISNIDQAIAAVDKGANTGVIASKFPSLTSASIELDNLRGSMGLDVIAGTTFGALSEAELDFALDTALPTRLSGPELKAWLQRKKEAQSKLAEELQDAAIYLGKPGNTAAGWLEMKRNQQGKAEGQTKTNGAQKVQAPPGAIQFLQANPTPEIKSQFKQKYGYLPEGM